MIELAFAYCVAFLFLLFRTPSCCVYICVCVCLYWFWLLKLLFFGCATLKIRSIELFPIYHSPTYLVLEMVMCIRSVMYQTVELYSMCKHLLRIMMHFTRRRHLFQVLPRFFLLLGIKTTKHDDALKTLFPFKSTQNFQKYIYSVVALSLLSFYLVDEIVCFANVIKSIGQQERTYTHTQIQQSWKNNWYDFVLETGSTYNSLSTLNVDMDELLYDVEIVRWFYQCLCSISATIKSMDSFGHKDKGTKCIGFERKTKKSTLCREYCGCTIFLSALTIMDRLSGLTSEQWCKYIIPSNELFNICFSFFR